MFPAPTIEVNEGPMHGELASPQLEGDAPKLKSKTVERPEQAKLLLVETEMADGNGGETPKYIVSLFKQPESEVTSTM